MSLVATWTAPRLRIFEALYYALCRCLYPIVRAMSGIQDQEAVIVSEFLVCKGQECVQDLIDRRDEGEDPCGITDVEGVLASAREMPPLSDFFNEVFALEYCRPKPKPRARDKPREAPPPAPVETEADQAKREALIKELLEEEEEEKGARGEGSANTRKGKSGPSKDAKGKSKMAETNDKEGGKTQKAARPKQRATVPGKSKGGSKGKGKEKSSSRPTRQDDSEDDDGEDSEGCDEFDEQAWARASRKSSRRGDAGASARYARMFGSGDPSRSISPPAQTSIPSSLLHASGLFGTEGTSVTAQSSSSGSQYLSDAQVPKATPSLQDSRQAEQQRRVWGSPSESVPLAAGTQPTAAARTPKRPPAAPQPPTPRSLLQSVYTEEEWNGFDGALLTELWCLVRDGVVSLPEMRWLLQSFAMAPLSTLLARDFRLLPPRLQNVNILSAMLNPGRVSCPFGCRDPLTQEALMEHLRSDHWLLPSSCPHTVETGLVQPSDRFTGRLLCFGSASVVCDLRQRLPTVSSQAAELVSGRARLVVERPNLQWAQHNDLVEVTFKQDDDEVLPIRAENAFEDEVSDSADSDQLCWEADGLQNSSLASKSLYYGKVLFVTSSKYRRQHFVCELDPSMQFASDSLRQQFLLFRPLDTRCVRFARSRLCFRTTAPKRVQCFSTGAPIPL